MSWQNEAKSALVMAADKSSNDANSLYPDDDDVGLNKVPAIDAREHRIQTPPPHQQSDAFKQFYGSTPLAFSSHACFFIASVFFIKLGCIDLEWLETTKDVPYEVFESDDEADWIEWAEDNENEDIVDLRKSYIFDRSLWYAFGSYFLLFVGLFDMMRFGAMQNVFMILAGITGIISGLSFSIHASDVFDCISVHLYLLQAINVLCRKHPYQGWHRLFHISDILFLVGCILDAVDSYAWLSGSRGTRYYVTDIIAAFLWLGCAIIDISAQIYFLPSGDDDVEHGCYIGRL